MAFNLQHSIIGGRLTKKPELKQTEGGMLICPFTVAVNLGSNENRFTEYNECVAYGKLAEQIAKHFDKGSEICVICQGGWRTREWTDRDGTKRYKTEHRVSDFSFVGTKNLPTAQAHSAPQENAVGAKYAAPAPITAPQFTEATSDDDLPF